MCEFGLFRQYSKLQWTEWCGSLECFMELSKEFALSSSIRKTINIAGWASSCLLSKNYLYLGSFSCENVELCCSRWADQSLWRIWVLHYLQTNLHYLKGTVVQTSWELYAECLTCFTRLAMAVISIILKSTDKSPVCSSSISRKHL